MSGDDQDASTDPRSDGGVDRLDDGVGSSTTGPDADLEAITADGVAYEPDVYAGLLAGFVSRGYEFVGFDGRIEDGQIAIRHDVDISLERAAAMARIEASLGVTSTYCLLVTNPLYDLLAPESRRHVRTILEAGHDVGLHFDPHYYWDAEPTVEDFESRVVADRTALERALDFHTTPGIEPEAREVAATSIHQPPDWTLGIDFDAFECTYAPPYFHDVEYVSDSAGKWRSERPFTDGVPDAMQLLVHPGLWQPEDRPMEAILSEHRDRCEERVERYVGPFGG